MTPFHPPGISMTTSRNYQPRFLYGFLCIGRAPVSGRGQGGAGPGARAGALSRLPKNFQIRGAAAPCPALRITVT